MKENKKLEEAKYERICYFLALHSGVPWWKLKRSEEDEKNQRKKTK